MASTWFNAGAKGIDDRSIDFASDTIDIILMASTYTANKDDAVVSTNITGGELSNVSGYVRGFGGAGRKTLASKTITNDTTNDRSVFDAADPTAWTLGAGDTVGGCVILKRGASDAASIPIAFLDPADVVTNGGTYTVQFDTNGIMYSQQ